MYVALNYYYDTYAYGMRADIQGMDLQLRIIEFFLRLQKQIVFKNRPKTAMLSEQFNHFGYFGERVRYTATPFTRVLHEADLFIFEGVGSTALYEAMSLTDTPIILFKPLVPKCTPAFTEMLQKRCRLIDLHEDQNNRLCFDEQTLRSSFAQ